MYKRQGEKVLLVLDESQHMIKPTLDDGGTLYRAVRSCLAPSVKGVLSRIFVVLVSTVSPISAFWPSIDDTSDSDRAAGERHKLITVLDTVDKRLAKSLPGDIRSYGRPLWAAYESVVVAIDMAARKLTLTTNAPSMSVRSFAGKKQLALVAVAAVRLALNVLPTHTDAQKLVSSHMATLLAVSSDRRKLAVAYPAEPILGESAARFWNGWYEPQSENSGQRTPEVALPTILDVVAEHVGTSLIATGERGELVGKLLWLLAADSCARLKEMSDRNDPWMFCNPFSLSSFVQALALDDSLDVTGWEEGTMRALAFVQLDDSLFAEEPQAVLARMYARGALGVMPPGHTGADLMAPVKVGDTAFSWPR